jgi:predicted nucleic acid-binding protein
MASALYWDASAILSLIVEDQHSARARRFRASNVPHLVSSLTFTEVCAVLARLEREGHISAQNRDRAIRSLRSRPWSALRLDPNRHLAAQLASRHPLRGADLWHLATTVTLASELPQLALLTFDTRLAEAARGEGLMEEIEAG